MTRISSHSIEDAPAHGFGPADAGRPATASGAGG
jgi:hypothetical protein